MAFTTINISTSGDNTVVAAPTAPNRYNAYELLLVPKGPVGVTVKDGSTAIIGPIRMGPGTGVGGLFMRRRDDEKPVIQTTRGSAFVVNLDAAVQVGGYVMGVTADIADMV